MSALKEATVADSVKADPSKAVMSEEERLALKAAKKNARKEQKLRESLASADAEKDAAERAIAEREQKIVANAITPFLATLPPRHEAAGDATAA